MTDPRAQSPSTPRTPDERRFPCANCGARLAFEPGTDSLTCLYCGHQNQIKQAEDAQVSEKDMGAYLARLAEAAPSVTATTATCSSCNAETTIPPNVTSYSCAFCASNIVAQGRGCSVIRPKAILPFKITRDQADGMFRTWVKSRWFAPTKLRGQAMLDAALTGMYMPAWTFDTTSNTTYTGQRGDAYYVTEWVTINGKRQSRQVRKIRWSSAAGQVRLNFDDVLVLSSKSLPADKVEALEPWDTQALVPYADDYLAGFTAERYQIDLPQGFEIAKGIMAPSIKLSIRNDIGGDEQRITSMHSTYSSTTFKHILLPLWLSAYRFRSKVYRFLVNARTGEVQGQRPYSPVKIGFAILGGLIALGVLIFLIAQR